jgi:hypothetical protein
MYGMQTAGLDCASNCTRAEAEPAQLPGRHDSMLTSGQFSHQLPAWTTFFPHSDNKFVHPAGSPPFLALLPAFSRLPAFCS